MMTNYKQTYATKLKSAANAVAPIKDNEALLLAMAIGQPQHDEAFREAVKTGIVIEARTGEEIRQ